MNKIIFKNGGMKMLYGIKQIKDFSRNVYQFIKNIILFSKLLWNYRWYSASYGIHYFLESYLRDIAKWYKTDYCHCEGHEYCSEQAQKALSILAILNNEHYYIPECNHEISFTESDKFGFGGINFPDCDCIPENAYEENDMKMNIHRDELFEILRDNYMDWWD